MILSTEFSFCPSDSIWNGSFSNQNGYIWDRNYVCLSKVATSTQTCVKRKRSEDHLVPIASDLLCWFTTCHVKLSQLCFHGSFKTESFKLSPGIMVHMIQREKLVPPAESIPLSSPPWVFLGVQKLKMPYPAWLRRQDEMTRPCKRPRGNSFVLVVHFLLIIYLLLNCNVQIKVEGSWLCLVFVRRVNETFRSSLRGCDWRGDVSGLKILERERGKDELLLWKSRLKKDYLEGHGSHVSCLYFASCVVESPLSFTFHMKVE